MSVREATAADLATWDARTVDAPAGNVGQSIAWGEHRASLGWGQLRLVVDDEHPVLVMTRRWPVIGGASAYIPRGPIAPRDAGEPAAARLAELARWLGATHGVDVVASDAEVPAADVDYRRVLLADGFRQMREIQPSRHRVSLPLAIDAGDDAVLAGISKSTRQRIAGAEDQGIRVARYDTAGWRAAVDVPLFEPTDGDVGVVLERFATMLEQTGVQRGFRFGPKDQFVAWWRRAHAAGYLVFLEALAPPTDASVSAGEPGTLGGLLLYRHGRRLTTVHAADTGREAHPGVMHLLRWRAIQLAIREGRDEMDLGGVDVGPVHAEPGPGDRLYGLYQHKRSYGGRWLELTGAHEQVLRPLRYAMGRCTARLARAARR